MAFTDTIGRIRAVEDANRAALTAAEEQAEARLRTARTEAAEVLAHARTQAEGAYTSELEFHRLSIEEDRARILEADLKIERPGLDQAAGRRDKVVTGLVERFLQEAPEV